MERFVVCALVGLLLTLYAWLGGGIVASWLTPWTPWLTLLLAEAALLIPEQRRGESLFDARRRVWRGLLRDPLAWCALLLIGFLAAQWLNACAFLEWDPAARAWQLASPAFPGLLSPEALEGLRALLPPAALAKVDALPPAEALGALVKAIPPPADPALAAGLPFLGTQPWGWLPWSLNANEAWGVLNWFPPVLVALLAARHALLKRTKRLLMAYVCLMTAALALAGIVQFAVGGDFLYWGRETRAFFFATFGYPNHAACWFPAVLLLSVGMALWAHEHRDIAFLHPAVYGACAVLCAVSGVLTGSRAGMLFTLAIVVLVALYVPLRYFGSWAPRVRLAVVGTLTAVAVVALGTAAFRMYAVTANHARDEAIREARVAKDPVALEAANALPAYPKMPAVDPVLGEIADTDWAAFFENPMLMRSGYQGILALRQYADHPWCGTGAWSFRWLNLSYIDPGNPDEARWFDARRGVGQANVHNDTLQFLAEHGTLGFALMVGCLLSLLIPFLGTLLSSPAHVLTDEQADRCWPNRLNVWCVFALFATALIALHSFIDLVFRSPACMMLYGLLFVCAPGFVVSRLNPPAEVPHA